MAELKYVDWDGLVYYDGKIKSYIADKAEDYLKMGGIISFEKLPAPSWQNLNYIYKITDEFTSNDRFEKPGYIYPAGTWIQVADFNEVYKYIIFNEEVIGGTSDIDLTNYYTKSEVEEKIEEAIQSIELPEVNLENYYTKSEVNDLIPDTSNLVTKEEFEVVQRQSASNDVKILMIEEEIFDINQRIDNTLATKEDLAAVESKIPSIEGLATKQELEDAINSIEHPTVDLEGYATEEYVAEKVAEIKIPTKVSELENDTGFLTEHQDLSEYAKKSDIPQPELFVIDYNSPNFADALDAYKAGKLLLLTNAAPDIDSYAVMNYVREDLITFTKFLMSRSGTYGSFNTYYLHNDNTWELAKEVKLNKVDAIVDANSDITGLTIGKDTYEFDNFATTEVVNQITENIQNTYVTNESLEQKNYVTEQHITENYITIQEAADTYVTNEKVTEVVTQEVETVVTEQIETKVETVIQEKVDNGEITVQSDSISYDTW